MTMATDTEALVRRAYHLAEGDVLDVQGFIDLFAEDGVFNGIGGATAEETYRGERLGDVVVFMRKFLPDQPTGAKLDMPTAGVPPDFASAVAKSAPARQG
jgi:hypothetical protein